MAGVAKPKVTVDHTKLLRECNRQEVRLRIKTRGSQVVVDDAGVTLRHIGKGEKRIPYQCITSVQLRPAGLMTNGFIRFGVLGGNEARRPLLDSSDDNGIVFGRGKNSEFAALRALVETRISKAQAAHTGSEIGSSQIADELMKLVSLRDRGVLTEAEFDRQKARLLGE